jgi:hypothetical protein
MSLLTLIRLSAAPSVRLLVCPSLSFPLPPAAVRRSSVCCTGTGKEGEGREGEQVPGLQTDGTRTQQQQVRSVHLFVHPARTALEQTHADRDFLPNNEGVKEKEAKAGTRRQRTYQGAHAR